MRGRRVRKEGRKWDEGEEGRKEVNGMKERKEGRKERKEGRKERKEGRKEGEEGRKNVGVEIELTT